MTKKKLRIKYKKFREEITPKEIEDWSIQIANKLLELPIWDYSYYHLFLSIAQKKEVNTEAILHILQGKDKNVVLSKSDFETCSLRNYLLTDSVVIQTNKWGIPEPVDGMEINNDKIEVVFVPLLVFDQNGHRIGYGKGFYDKFLAQCRPGTIKVGLSFFEAGPLIPGLLESDV
ncbi:MAG TPA: 5-formyltetrahydrofolate cyclo-ligase, partial [Salinimicrobium sp.]|nr:5-formyltetrahydrofolate cyclo-ligase [Salinimicrobium sp.]